MNAERMDNQTSPMSAKMSIIQQKPSSYCSRSLIWSFSRAYHAVVVPQVLNDEMNSEYVLICIIDCTYDIIVQSAGIVPGFQKRYGILFRTITTARPVS
jgi:hypothetical protein